MAPRPIAVRAAGLTNVLYTTGDQMGTEMSFPVGPAEGFTRGYIVGVTITDNEDEVTATDLFLFSAPASPAADNAANSWADANMDTFVAVLSASTILDAALNKALVYYPPVRIPFQANGGILYGNLVARGAPPGYSAATALLVTLWVETQL
jgi:hypothetical protein